MNQENFWKQTLTDFQSYHHEWHGKVAILVKRYKRFLADFYFQDHPDQIYTAYCPNTGKMSGIQDPGSTIMIIDQHNPKAVQRFIWVATQCKTETGVQWIGCNTNLVSGWALKSFQKSYPHLTFITEPRLASGARFDLALKYQDHYAYIEVKNVHASFHPDTVAFPDTITIRGQQHMKLIKQYQQRGAPCMILYMVQRNDCHKFEAASWIDPNYALLYQEAKDVGAQSAMMCCSLDLNGATVQRFQWLD